MASLPFQVSANWTKPKREGESATGVSKCCANRKGS
jgi:hypothetical protein